MKCLAGAVVHERTTEQSYLEKKDLYLQWKKELCGDGSSIHGQAVGHEAAVAAARRMTSCTTAAPVYSSATRKPPRKSIKQHHRDSNMTCAKSKESTYSIRWRVHSDVVEYK
jgi:hypothetical protein